MAVTEIRRQRELFEQKKKQKFVEKQRKKKLRSAEKMLSDDGATYSVHRSVMCVCVCLCVFVCVFV